MRAGRVYGGYYHANRPRNDSRFGTLTRHHCFGCNRAAVTDRR